MSDNQVIVGIVFHCFFSMSSANGRGSHLMKERIRVCRWSAFNYSSGSLITVPYLFGSTLSDIGKRTGSVRESCPLYLSEIVNEWNLITQDAETGLLKMRIAGMEGFISRKTI